LLLTFCFWEEVKVIITYFANECITRTAINGNAFLLIEENSSFVERLKKFPMVDKEGIT
jgi:hypothetical protein